MTWFEFGPFRLEEETQILTSDGRQVALAPKAAELLLLFLENPAKLFSKDELKAHLWKDVNVDGDNNLAFQLSCVREALGQHANGARYIENLPRRGYRFVSPVKKRCAEVETALASGTDQSSTGQIRSGSVEAPRSPVLSARLSRRHWAAYAISGSLTLLAITVTLVYRLATEPLIRIAQYVPLTHDGIEKAEGPLFTDGVRVYFWERGQTGTTLSAVAVGGGGTGTIPLPTGFELIYDLSPQTSEVLAGKSGPDGQGRELWVVPLLGGSPRRVGDLRSDDARWSPDKSQIAFALNRDLYIANGDGTEPRKIAEVPGNVYSPRWSSDGKTLLFSAKSLVTVDNGLWSEIWEVEADGSNLHRLLAGWNNPPNQCCAVWMPDGRSFVFQATRDGRTDLWAASEKRFPFSRSDSGTPVRLTSGLEGYFSPTLSAVEKQLFAIGMEKRGVLVSYDSRLREFVPFLGGIAATWVTYSRSGQSVAYIRHPDRTVWRANSDGSEKHQVTFSPFEADGLSWSPDGKWFALRGRTPGKPWQIYLLPSSGGEAEALVPGETEQGIPTWSPDSRRIAFGDVPLVNGTATGKESIHILDLSKRTLADLPGSHGLWTARWSPDGRSLAALAIKGERLVLYDFKTMKWHTTDANTVNNPTWSRDGMFVYFDTEGHHRALCRVSAADGHVDELVNLDGHATLSWWWSGVTPDDSPLILRNIGSDEIYSLTLESR